MRQIIRIIHSFFFYFFLILIFLVAVKMLKPGTMSVEAFLE